MQKQRTAFSLIEVLICVAVILVLMALIAPVVESYFKRATAAKCVSNLRQIGLALFAFSAENNGRIPARVEPDPDRPGLFLSGTYWHQVLRRGGYFGPPPREVTGPERMAAQKKGVHFCPEIPSTGTSDEAYGMRRWRSPGQPIDTSQNVKAIEKPSDFFLLADSYMVSRKQQGYSLGTGSSSWRIRFTHDNLANTLFADGHVAAKGRDYFDRIVSEQAEYGYTTEKYAYWPELSDNK